MTKWFPSTRTFSRRRICKVKPFKRYLSVDVHVRMLEWMLRVRMLEPLHVRITCGWPRHFHFFPSKCKSYNFELLEIFCLNPLLWCSVAQNPTALNKPFTLFLEICMKFEKNINHITDSYEILSSDLLCNFYLLHFIWFYWNYVQPIYCCGY